MRKPSPLSQSAPSNRILHAHDERGGVRSSPISALPAHEGTKPVDTQAAHSLLRGFTPQAPPPGQVILCEATHPSKQISSKATGTPQPHAGPLRAQQRSALDKEQMLHVKRSESHHKAASGQTPSTTTRPRVTPPKEDGARNARPSARRPHGHAGGKPRSASGSRAPSGDRARSQDPDRSSQSAARALRTCTPCHPRALCERQPPWKTAFLALQASSPYIAKKRQELENRERRRERGRFPPLAYATDSQTRGELPPPGRQTSRKRTACDCSYGCECSAAGPSASGESLLASDKSYIKLTYIDSQVKLV